LNWGIILKLYIKQKVFSLTDKYNICDELGNPVFFVTREFLSLGAKFHILDNQGIELYFISQKLLTFLAEYHIFKNSEECAKIKKQLTLFKPKILIESTFGAYQISGDLFSMRFDIECNSGLVGSISKKLLSWGDSYELDISDEVDPAFFCCLAIAIDHCLHNDNK